jgi:hypothetical protein
VNSGRATIIFTLLIAFGLGTFSLVTIRRTARHRTALVDEVIARMPAIPRARVLVGWEPATYADEVRANYCLDDAGPGDGAARAVAAFTAAGWTTTALERDAATDTVVFTMTGPVRLRGVVGRGHRAECEGAHHQVGLALEGAR